MYIRNTFYLTILNILLFCFFSSHTSSQHFTKITTGPEVNDGGWCYGACWADFNHDGWLDLFVVNNQTGSNNNFLYLNNGDGTFTKVTSGIIVNDDGSSYGCTCGDYDNDGNIDVFVSNYGQNNFLYHNDGNGNFTKITSGAIVNDGGNSAGCAWGDYDNDGYLDLYVCNRNIPNFLYHNNGNGTFTKITSGAIVTDNYNSGGCAWGDYDNDGYIDMYVANAGPAVDNLYRNNGNGTFTKILNDPVVSDTAHSSGGSWGDYDNDGDLDLFVSGGVVGSSYDRLFRNNGNGTFTKITGDPIVSYFHWAGGAGWADFNNDGYPDMFVGGYDGINLLFVNNGNGTFTRIDTGVVVNDGNYKEGALWGDYDNDGDIDLFVARNNYFGGNNVLYMNNGNSNNWVNIRCVGIVSNKSGIGAKLFARAVINSSTVRQMQAVSSQTGGSISGQSSLNAEFGLGNASIIDSLVILWPSGIIDKYTNIAVNHFYTAIEGQGLTDIKRNASKVPESFSLFQNYPNPFNPSTKIKFSLPRPSEGGVQSVRLTVYDLLGKEVETLVPPLGGGQVGLQPVTYEVDFNGTNYPSGVYFYKLNVGKYSESKKMVLLK
jgi:hypothetical protein